MYYFGFVELIERAIKWAKEYGGWAYWIWVGVSGLLGGIALRVCRDSGIAGDAKPFIAAALLWWVVLLYPVHLLEKKRKKEK